MRLFVEDLKGYMDVYENVNKVSIKKIDNKNKLIINYDLQQRIEFIDLKEVRLAFMIDKDTLIEYFRYEK